MGIYRSIQSHYRNGFRVFFFAVWAISACAQEGRRIISQVTPTYPQLARRLNLSGSVKIDVVIAVDGHIKESKILGGHPLFVTAAQEALKSWKYAPSNSETTATLEFNFHP